MTENQDHKYISACEFLLSRLNYFLHNSNSLSLTMHNSYCQTA